MQQLYNKHGLLIDDLLLLLKNYLDESAVTQINAAYFFAEQAHAGQRRKTGEAYICHPLAVAVLLADMRSDATTIKAALLHDVIEDTKFSKQDLTDRFGIEVAQIVDGVSKLDKLALSPKLEPQFESFRKMMLAMSQDIRVILIKLADRLHNMRTLYGMRAPKRKTIARETMDVYVPIAQRIGMYEVMQELEDLSFENIYPFRRRVLLKELDKARAQANKDLQEVSTKIYNRLKQYKIKAKIKTREKSLYSIYKKMRDKKLKFSELNDIHALRLITDTADNCYRVLGVLHNMYKPLPGKFKDYIAIPKGNGYQSLHTILFLGKGQMVEMQIRTKAMNKVAESGIASHWKYKTGDDVADLHSEKAVRNWVAQVKELQEISGDSQEFMENLKVDLFPDKVYVFTPQGEIAELPRGATALDFAYNVHTDIGNHCKQAYIDNQLVPLGQPLRNGQTIDVTTDLTVKPLPSWLNIVATSRARSSIRSALRKLHHFDAAKLGTRMMDNSLQKSHIKRPDITKQQWSKLLESLNLKSIDSLHESIGQGRRLADLVVRILLEQEPTPDKPKKTLQSVFNIMPRIHFLSKRKERRDDLQISGTEGMSVVFAKCCYPLPGDNIVGHFNSGRGIVVHRIKCKNLKRLKQQPERLVDLQWHTETSGDFASAMQLKVMNRRGALAAIAAQISNANSNIEKLDIVSEVGDDHNQINIILRVQSRQHLAEIVRLLKKSQYVKKIKIIKNEGVKDE